MLVTFLVGHVKCAMADETTLPLAGIWNFRLDAKDVGVTEKWFALRPEGASRNNAAQPPSAEKKETTRQPGAAAPHQEQKERPKQQEK